MSDQSVGLSCLHIPSRPDLPTGHITESDPDAYLPQYSETHPTGPVEMGAVVPRWISARVWRGGISVGSGVHPRDRASRGSVTGLSDGSGRRMVRFLEEADASYRYLGTLTVAGEFSEDSADFRAAVDRWLTWFQRAQEREAQAAGDDPTRESVFWWVEFQNRGAPHLHIFYTRRVPWEAAAKKWELQCKKFGLCDHDDDRFWRTSTKFEKLRHGWRSSVSYARKYAAKAEQKRPPEGYWNGRMWGVRGNRKRGSCHITRSYKPGGPSVSRLVKNLDLYVKAGVLRRIYWEKGDGACYYLRGNREWSDFPELLGIVHVFMCKMIVGTDADSLPL